MGEDGSVTSGTVTDALLSALIQDAPSLAEQTHALLSPVAEGRAGLRDALTDGREHVHQISDRTLPPYTLAAVDGGCVREQMYAADFLVAVATAANGMTSQQELPLAHHHWSAVRAHETENAALLSAAMASLELRVLADLPHSIRIVDGSFMTPVIALLVALASRSESVAEAAADLVTDELLHAATQVYSAPTEDSPVFLALPKSDSSRKYAKEYWRRYSIDMPGNDKFISALLLNPGEFLHPRPASEFETVGSWMDKTRQGRPADRARALHTAVRPLIDGAHEGRVVVTYVKPVTTETVVKVEMWTPGRITEHDTTRNSAALKHVAQICRLLSDETPGPHLQEPFAQYAVDVAAKSVSAGSSALRQAMTSSLPPGAEAYRDLLTRSYRT